MKRVLNLFLIICMLTGCAQKPIAPVEEPLPPAVVEESAEEVPLEEKETTTEVFAVETVSPETIEPAETTEPASDSIAEEEAVPTATPQAIPEPTATPEPTAAPVSAPAPTKAPAPASLSYGSIPFNLSEFQYDWWSIDGSDDAYWACANNINSMRRAAGLSDLAVDSGLSSIANSRCEQIVASGDFSHSGMCTAGEILGENYNSASAVCNAWQTSSGHYAQILGNYSSMGIGCVFEQGGQTVWCVVFS